MTAQKGWRKLLATVTTGLLVIGGLATAPLAANAAETKTLLVDVVETAKEGITANITGTGYEDAPQYNGQEYRSVYVALIEEGTDLSEVGADTAFPNASLRVADDGTINGSLEQTAANLDESKTYEVISWPTLSAPTEDNLFARATLDIDWNAVFPPAPVEETPELSATVTAASDAGLSVATELTGVQEKTGYMGAYIVIVEADQVDSLKTSQNYLARDWIRDISSGSVNLDLTLKSSDIDRSKDYVAVAWRAHGNLTDERFIAQTDLKVTDEQWDAVFPPAPVEAGDELVWGFKQSWRNYVSSTFVGGTTASEDGASIDEDGLFHFPVADASGYDLSTGEGVVQYSGTIRFTSSVHNFDIVIANPWVTFSDGGHVITLSLEMSNVSKPGDEGLTRVDAAEFGTVVTAGIESDAATSDAGESVPVSLTGLSGVFLEGIQPTELARYAGQEADPLSLSFAAVADAEDGDVDGEDNAEGEDNADDASEEGAEDAGADNGADASEADADAAESADVTAAEKLATTGSDGLFNGGAAALLLAAAGATLIARRRTHSA